MLDGPQSVKAIAGRERERRKEAEKQLEKQSGSLMLGSYNHGRECGFHSLCDGKPLEESEQR